MPNILHGKIAIVTGAGRGIGRAIAEEYAAEGAKVVVASRTPSTVDEVVAAITAKGGSAIGFPCDVGDPLQINAMVAHTVASFGGVDILVNNAQGFGTRESQRRNSPPVAIESLTDAELDWVFDTGLKATLRAMQAVFPHLRARGGGRVINFGSLRGIISTPYTGAYNITKEAIRGLSRTAANEWGQYGITVNVINPVIETDAFRADFAGLDEQRDQFIQTIPLRRIGQPRDCARVAVFLASEDSSYITGMMFTADGGLTSIP